MLNITQYYHYNRIYTNNSKKYTYNIQQKEVRNFFTMGPCHPKKVRKSTQKHTQQYWRQPEDTDKLANLSLTKLQFQGTLANFKIINCQYSQISIKVQIKGVDTFLLRLKKLKSDQSAHWAFQHKFQFQMTQYQLRKAFVEIFIYDQNQMLIGQTKVNLFLISSGPYHQNFAIFLKKGSNTRIYFDLKISQIIQIQLDSIQLQIDLMTKHPGQKFNYSIKPIVGHHQELNSSQRSYTVKVKLDDKQNIQKQNKEQIQIIPKLQRKITIKNAQKLIAQGHNLVWTKSDYLPMPSIVMKTLVTDLHHCYFQIIFWKINDKTSTKQEQMSQLFAECFVALHKIFDIEPTSVSTQQGLQEKRIFTSQDKLWHNGQEIGKGKFKFQVLSDKYIKQMQVMVRTEQGIVKYSPVFFSNIDKNQSTCPQLKQLLKIQQQIQQSAVKLDRFHTEGSQQPSMQNRRIKVSIQENLQRLLNLLQKSSQTNIILYSYSSSLQMMRAQQLFLNLGFKTMGYLQEEDFHINDLCWEILTAIIGRGQFMLFYVGFDQNQKNKISQNRLDKNLQRKIDIALTYHQFMSKMLRIAVNSLSVQGLEMEKSFAQIFCAYAYFRIQNFRSAILQVFTRKNDPQLPEWRGIQFTLQHDVDYDQLKQQVNTFTALFDWPNNFHKCIQHHERYQASSMEIHEILVRQDWKFRLAKRGITFFQFVKCWVEYVQSIVVKTKDIQWKYFPGYNKLLKCFLCEMKKRSILQYPDILKASMFKLLANQKLLNPIVMILFNKANIYEPLTVIRAIVLISQIFTIFCQKNKKIPVTFNYFNFYQGIKIIMESQFSFAISKTIVMLYNYFTMFTMDFRRNISMFLLGKVFFKLFLHWSYNVRHVFHHLVMRVYHESLRIDLSSSKRQNQQYVNQQIRKRYLKLQGLLQQALVYKKQLDRTNYFRTRQKDLHKQLKRKMDMKKRQIKRSQTTETFGLKCPESPSSQKFMNTIIFNDDKFQLEKNRKGEMNRSQSEILRPIIKLTYKISSAQKEQQVKVLNKKNTGDFRHKIYDNTKGQKILMKSTLNDQYLYDETDFQIAKIEPQLLQYIEQAMFRFKSTNQVFTKNFNNKNWTLPKIKMEMPLDSRQIRPDKIDDW